MLSVGRAMRMWELVIGGGGGIFAGFLLLRARVDGTVLYSAFFGLYVRFRGVS